MKTLSHNDFPSLPIMLQRSLLFHPIQFLHHVTDRLWEDICTVRPKSNQVSGPSTCTSGWYSKWLEWCCCCHLKLELLMCVMWLGLLCDILLLHSPMVWAELVQHKPTLMHSLLSHMMMSAHSFNHSPTPRASSLHFMRGKSWSQIHPFALLPPHCYIIQWHQLRCTKQIFFHLFMLPHQRKYDGPKMEHADHCHSDWLKLLQHHHLLFYSGWKISEAEGVQMDWNLGPRSEAEISEWRVNMLIIAYLEYRAFSTI